MMKATLPRVGCIGLLGSPLDVSLQRALSLCLLGHIQLDSLFYAKRPNAANHPPAHPACMRSTLQRVGCIGLLDRPTAAGCNPYVRSTPLSAGANARHHPPRTQRNKHGVLRMKAALFAVGCMPLFGCP